MTMKKKEYIRPEQNVLIIDTKASILMTSNENESGIPGEGGESDDDEGAGRNDFARPGSGNVWDQSW